MTELEIKTLEAELEGIETGFEVLMNNVHNSLGQELGENSMRLVSRIEKRLTNMKKILKST